MSSQAMQPAVSRATVGKVVFASSLGTTMEFFDYYAYGIAAAVAFPALFFGPLGPSLAVAISLVSTLMINVGRPIGGFIFGHLGDTRGRTSSLVLALTIMGLSTLGIGLLPTYAEIGIMAPVLLFTFRIIQGVGLGGEWGGALTWARETAGKSRWAGFLTGGVVQSAPGWGTFLSSGVSTLIIASLGPQFFAAPWGSWRYIFYIGATVLAISAVIRLSLIDSPIFVMLKSAGRTVRSPIGVAFRNYWRRIIMFSFMLGTINFTFIYTSYVLPYFQSKGFPLAIATAAVSVSGVATIIATLAFGLFVDLFGRKRLGFLATLWTLLMVYPYWYCVTSLNPTLVYVGTILLAASCGCISGVFPPFFLESFPTEVRQTAGGVSLQLASFWYLFIYLFITPIIGMVGAAAAVPYILLVLSAYTIVSLILWALPSVRETKGKELTETQPMQIKGK